ncbi:hypothetical protein [Demequina gelatinilytica]|uniref:hypothetical protein n=1 Tax=Demequina gelatinilytica TaxID=1638980 RepID=UPI0007840DEF|nr:hypothetical protein [Demequina gelatinilytica]
MNGALAAALAPRDGDLDPDAVAAATARARRRIVRRRRRTATGAVAAGAVVLAGAAVTAVLATSPADGPGGMPAADPVDPLERVERSVPAAEPRADAVTADAWVAGFAPRTDDEALAADRQAALLCEVPDALQGLTASEAAWLGLEPPACLAGSVAGPVLEPSHGVQVVDGVNGSAADVAWAAVNVSDQAIVTAGWSVLFETAPEAAPSEATASVLGSVTLTRSLWLDAAHRSLPSPASPRWRELGSGSTLLAQTHLDPDRTVSGATIDAAALRTAIADGAAVTGAVVVPFEDDPSTVMVLEVPLTGMEPW